MRSGCGVHDEAQGFRDACAGGGWTDADRGIREQGFDSVRGDSTGWRVVHVEYRCPDGVEHVMCGLPEDWDPRLVLGVMVKGQIG